ncbi:hypothetical protein GCM10009804_41940 [Kribbella hippodromi]|uniref:Uncharacterized protein n=1 Tax=Kribbella hippodromi TaxID=434347 RepID=A0ABN2DMQ6_9ACTN
MDFELLLLIVIAVGLVLRALWASAVLHRHVGWLIAAAWIGGLVGGLILGYEWLAIACVLLFGVAEFVYQTGGDGSKAPPARWLSPLLRRLSVAPPGRHGRKPHDEV